MSFSAPEAPEGELIPAVVLTIDGTFPANFDMNRVAHADYFNHISFASAVSHLFNVD
jgi:hypothetical protein